MESERRAPGLAAYLTTGENTGGSPVSYKHKCNVQDILSEIQNLVDKSKLINVSMKFF